MEWLRLINRIDVPALRPGTVGAYAFAFVCAAAATALRITIEPYLTGFQYISFVPAVMITTLMSGFAAGLICVLLCTAAIAFFYCRLNTRAAYAHALF